MKQSTQSDPVCRVIDFSGVLSSVQKTGSLYHIFLLQLSIREVARQFPKIGYTTLQGRLSGRVLGYGHASGGKGILPPDTEGE